MKKKEEEGAETNIRRSSKVIRSLGLVEEKERRERVGARRGGEGWKKQLVGCELSSIGLPETVRNGHSSSRSLKKKAQSIRCVFVSCLVSDLVVLLL